jgi:hypothetical protein
MIGLAKLIDGLFRDENLERRIEMKLEELSAQLLSVSSQMAKAKDEILTRIAELEAAVGNAGELPPEVVDAVNAVIGAAQQLDDIVPDAPPPV